MFSGGLCDHTFGNSEAHGGFNFAELQRLQFRLTFGFPVQVAINRLAQNRQRAVMQFFRGNNAVNEANFQRLIGTDVFTGGNNFQRAIGAEQARQTYGTAEARHNAQLGFRQADAQIRRGEAIVGRQYAFAAAAQRVAVNR